MTPEDVFQLANGTAPLAWLAMIAAPDNRWVKRTVLSGAWVAMLASMYFLVVATHFNFTAADFTTLEGVTALLSDPWAMTAGWIHYLAFDLLAGVITVAPALALALTGAAALPGVLALAGTKPVLRFINVAVNHELSGLLVRVPVVFVHGFLVWEEFTEMVRESLSGRGSCNNSKNEFHF